MKLSQTFPAIAIVLSIFALGVMAGTRQAHVDAMQATLDSGDYSIPNDEGCNTDLDCCLKHPELDPKFCFRGAK